MKLPKHKTKIVATIGPASKDPAIMEKLLVAGMNIARLNFSHGDFSQHEATYHALRDAASKTGRRLAIMADLPGPKMRLGEIADGPLDLQAGDPFTLTTEDIVGDARRANMSFDPLPKVVHPGDRLYLNDGLVQLLVDTVEGPEVHCTVSVGGTISSRKGLNLPRIPLGISAFTDHDRRCLEFALKLGVDAVSQSFVENAEDIEAVRAACHACGAAPMIIAKIERCDALKNYESILAAADGIMVARGDLGVEVPIEDMAVTQKRIITRARQRCKPVITATQMLESMTVSRLPTRAEATDVANAILDGTDCVMLSAESAAGRFPVESVEMLSRIAQSVERFRETEMLQGPLELPALEEASTGRQALLVEHAIAIENVDAVLVPSRGGSTARAVARWRPKTWVITVGRSLSQMQHLSFCYGVHPVDMPDPPDDWNAYAAELMRELELPARQILLVAGPSPKNPNANQRLEIIAL